MTYDPLDIMNEFTKWPLGEPSFPNTDYWIKRLAALCNRMAKAEAENKRLRTLLDSLMQELEITDTATTWKRITSAVKPEHAEALEQYFREWEATE